VKPSTNQCLGHERLSSASSAATVQATIPPGTSHVLIGVETTSCRMTMTATGDPTSTTGLPVYAGQSPWFLAVGQGCTLKFASMAGTASIIQLAYLS
jgi:hypothetical protein